MEVKIVIALVGMLLLLGIIMRGLGHLTLIVTFNKRLKHKKKCRILKTKQFENLISQDLQIKSDGNMLYGQIYFVPGRQYKGIIIVVHGHKVFHDDYLNEINFFASNNYLVYAYDTTGCGESEGKLIKGHPRWFLDLNNVITFFEKNDRYKKYKIYLFGHSMGGYAVTAVLNFSHDNIAAVVACSPVNSGFDFGFLTWKNHKNIFFKQLYLGMKNHEYKYFGEYALYTSVGGINNYNIPVMVLHGKNDKTVPINYSLYSYKDQITNPNAVFKLFETKSHYVYKENVKSEFLSAFTAKLQQPYECNLNYKVMDFILSFYSKY